MPGVCDRNGRRRKRHEGKPDRRGKYDRSKINEEEEAEALDTMDLHADCKEVMLEFYNTESSKYKNYVETIRNQSEQAESDSE